MEEKKKKSKLIVIIITIVVIIGAIAGTVGVIKYLNSPSYKYEKANKLEQEEKFEDALAIYKEIEEYENSKEKIKVLKRKVLNLEGVANLINNKVLYYNGGDNTILCQITFTENEATIKKVKFSGNGQGVLSTNVYNWDLDTEKIIVNNELNIGYKVENENIIFEAGTYKSENENITFEDGKYFTPEQVTEGIQGYWKLRKTTYVLGRFITSEHNIYINGDKITAQDATEASYGYADYYYSDPEEKTYSLDIGNIKATNGDGTISGTFMGFNFNIIDNQIKVLHYDKVMEKTDSLPDVNSYSF